MKTLFNCCEQLRFLEEIFCDYVLSENNLTIRGRMIDNYGKPLAHYEHVYYMEKGNRAWYSSSELDAEGRFVISNAPRAEIIMIKKETYSESYGWQHDSKTKNVTFVPYPEKEFVLMIPPDVNEFDAGDLVLDYPDITAEIYVVDFQGNPIGFVECAFERIGSQDLLKDRYWKVTNEQEGKCVVENLARVEGSPGRAFKQISLRLAETAPREHRLRLASFTPLTRYHLHYPGDHKHYLFELVLPRKGHHQDRKMRIYSAEGELLKEDG